MATMNVKVTYDDDGFAIVSYQVTGIGSQSAARWMYFELDGTDITGSLEFGGGNTATNTRSSYVDAKSNFHRITIHYRTKTTGSTSYDNATSNVYSAYADFTTLTSEKSKSGLLTYDTPTQTSVTVRANGNSMPASGTSIYEKWNTETSYTYGTSRNSIRSIPGTAGQTVSAKYYYRLAKNTSRLGWIQSSYVYYEEIPITLASPPIDTYTSTENSITVTISNLTSKSSARNLTYKASNNAFSGTISIPANSTSVTFTITGLTRGTTYQSTFTVDGITYNTTWKTQEVPTDDTFYLKLISDKTSDSLTVYFEFAQTRNYSRTVIVTCNSRTYYLYVYAGYTIASRTITGLSAGTQYTISYSAVNEYEKPLPYCTGSLTSFTSFNFAWDQPKVSGEEWNLTAVEWNRFMTALVKLGGFEGKTITKTTVAKGDLFTAAIFNEAVNGVNKIQPNRMNTVSKGDKVFARYFNELVSFLNGR